MNSLGDFIVLNDLFSPFPAGSDALLPGAQVTGNRPGGVHARELVRQRLQVQMRRLRLHVLHAAQDHALEPVA